MKKIALYIRVSTQEQAQDGYSISKLHIIRRKQGLSLIFMQTADNLNRSCMQSLISDIKEFDIVFVYFDTASPLGKAMVGLLAVFAQLEREQIKQRTALGRLARVKSGLYHGAGHIPIGYDYQDGKLIVNVYEAEQVKKIFQMYLDGFSYNAIANILVESGYQNRYSVKNNSRKYKLY